MGKSWIPSDEVPEIGMGKMSRKFKEKSERAFTDGETADRTPGVVLGAQEHLCDSCQISGTEISATPNSQLSLAGVQGNTTRKLEHGESSLRTGLGCLKV